MSLNKISPTHRAIETLNSTIKMLKLQRDALIATLPPVKKTERKSRRRVIIHPLTGEKSYYERK